MGILTLLRNAFGRSRKGRAAEAEGADRTPLQEPAPSPTAENPTPKVPTPSPEPTPAPTPSAQVPEPRPSLTDDEHDLVSAAFDNVTVPKPATSAESVSAEPAETVEAVEAVEPVETPVETEPVAEVTPEPEPEPVAEVEPEPVAEVTPEAEPVAEATTEPEPEATAEVTPEPEPVAEVADEPEPVVEPTAEVTEAAPEPVAEVAAEPEPEPVVEPTTEAAPEPVAESEPEPVAEVTPEPEPEAAEEAEPVAAEATEPPAAEEDVPAPAEEDVQAATEETAPATAEETAPAAAEADAPAAAEEEVEAEAEAVTDAEVEAVVEEELVAVAAAIDPAAADGETAPQGPLAVDDESSTGGAGGNTEAEGEAEAEADLPPSLLTAYNAAAETLAAHNLTTTRATVYLVLDRSASMRPYYKDGSAQSLGEQTLALAAHLDPNAKVHVVFFSTELDGTGELTLPHHENKIDDLHAGLGRMGRTSYHAAVEAVLTHHEKSATPSAPALVVFQTDGAPDAKTPATQSLTDAAKNHPSVFFSFVAFGEHDNKAFDYLRKLKTDNTSFFHAGPTPRELTDTELYEGVLANWRP